MVLNRIRRSLTSIRSFVSRAVRLSSYQYGRLLFAAAAGTVGLAVVTAVSVEIGCPIPLLSSFSRAPTNDFFGSSLNLILSIISLVFLVVIFLVQNATQEYSSRLSGVILRDRYFLGTIGFILVGSIFSISGSYFEPGEPFTLIGYAFSIATILLVGALIAFTGYFLNIANIIAYITKQIEREITADRIYQPNPFGVPLQDDEYIRQLTSRTQLIVSTCIQAIEQNQQPVVDSCLDSLTNITEQFLDQTTERDVNEDFLQELNDQFQFIGSTAFEEYSRQKHSESVVEAIGDIGVKITNSRELGAQAGSWASLLGDLFTDSLEFDRTNAAALSIQKLGEMSTTALNQGDFDTFRLCLSECEDISTVCAAGNHPYLASLMQSLHGQYQKMYATYLYALLAEGHTSEYDRSQLLEEFANSFNEGKSTYGFYNDQVLFAGLFGLKPFAGKVAAPLLQHQDPDPRTQQVLKEDLEALVDFLHEISLTNTEANQPDLYKGYTQFLFTFEQAVPLESDDKLELVAQLNDTWLQLVDETYSKAIEDEENVEHRLNERMSDVTALLIYFNKDDPDALAELIEPYAAVYRDLADTYDDTDTFTERNLKNLYKQLKLAGAWINRFHDPEQITPELGDVLVDDFYEIPETHSRLPRPLMPRYGYPNDASFSRRDGWWLYPDALWSYTGFQDEITDTLNGEDSSNYPEFHERLQEAHESR